MARVVVEATHEQALANTQPHGWALGLLARSYRRLARRWIVMRHVRRLCSPFELEGGEYLSQTHGPTLIIANHTSHFDTLIVLSILPQRLYNRTAVAAAADRFYRESLKGAWYSLRYNAFPIARNGGKAALDYSYWLLRHDWSLLIFPEGTRSKTGNLLPFHPGPAILALKQNVPVLPIHIEGASKILQPGTRQARPAHVLVRVGPPLSFDKNSTVMEVNAKMEEVMQSLAMSEEREAIGV